MTARTNAHIAHGVTLDEVWTIARNSASANRYLACDPLDLIDAAYGAVVELLLTAETRPSDRDLYAAAKTGIQQLVRTGRRHHGYRNRDAINGPGSAPKFAAYWAPVAPEAPFEQRVIEHWAVCQILRALTDRDRDVLGALAALGDYTAAASSLGMPPASYRSYISQARRRIDALWCQHETPRPRTGYAHRNPNRGRKEAR